MSLPGLYGLDQGVVDEAVLLLSLHQTVPLATDVLEIIGQIKSIKQTIIHNLKNCPVVKNVFLSEDRKN